MLNLNKFQRIKLSGEILGKYHDSMSPRTTNWFNLVNQDGEFPLFSDGRLDSTSPFSEPIDPTVGPATGFKIPSHESPPPLCKNDGTSSVQKKQKHGRGDVLYFWKRHI